jgi:hypothetical protein
MLRKTLITTSALVLGVSLTFAGPKTGQTANRISLREGKPGIPSPLDHSIPAAVMITKAGAGPVHNNVSHWVPGATFNNFGKDKNAEFVSWYGFAAVSAEYSSYVSSHYHYKFSEVGFNATPFTGNGKAPKTMTFAGFAYSNASTAEFEGAILSATTSGLPGKAIATTSATTLSETSLCCHSVRTVKFHRAPVLTSGKEYFAAVECVNRPCEGGWAMEDTDFSGAVVDYWHVHEKETYGDCTGSCSQCVGSSCVASYSSPWHESTKYPTAGAAIIK